MHYKWDQLWKVFLFMFLIFVLTGCLPRGMPAFLNDGKIVIATTPGKLWVYDVGSGAVNGYSLLYPEMRGKLIGDQLWVHIYRGDNEKPKSVCERFDLNKKEFVHGPKELDELGDWVEGAVETSCEGKKCLLLVEKTGYSIYSFPELKKVKTAENTPIPLKGFWSATTHYSKKEGKDVLDGLEVFDSEGKSVAKVPPKEVRKMEPILETVYLRVSENKEVLILADVRQPGDALFGVFEMKTGNFLWGGVCLHLIRGNPLIRRDEGWALTHVVSGLALVHYKKSEKGNPEVYEPETVIKYPIDDQSQIDEYNITPDGKEFVVCVHGEKPRLLFIPIKKEVTEKDVRVVELK